MRARVRVCVPARRVVVCARIAYLPSVKVDVCGHV